MSRADTESTTALWWSLLAALAAGGLADAYLAWGSVSATAFSLPALLLPLTTAAMLVGIIAATLAALRPLTRATAAIAGAIALLAIALSLLDLTPPVARDELTHHLAIPALYLRAQRIVEVPFAEQSYYPMLIEMAYTPLLQWLPDNLPKCLHLLYGLASAALVMLHVRRTRDAALAALAGLLVLSTPAVFVLSSSAYIDLGLLFYSTAALVALLRWSDDFDTRWLAAGALLAGCAGATKYNGLLVIVLLSAVTVLLPRAEIGGAQRLRSAMLFAGLALLPVLPWLLKNAAQTGNPMFPLFNTLLGGRPLPLRRGIDLLTQRRALYGESWLDVALIPARIFLTGRDGDPARFDGVLSPLLLLGIGAAVSRNASRHTRVLALYAGVYALLAFFLISLRVRYSIVIVAPLVLLAIDQLAHLLRAGGAAPMLARLAVGGTLLFSAAHFVQLWQRVDPLPYLTGHLGRDGYIAQFVPEYAALQFANRTLPPTARLYLLFLGNRSYYCERDYFYDTYFSGVALRQHIEASTDADDLAARLRRAGLSHLLSADALLTGYLRDALSDEQRSRWDDFAQRGLRRLYSRGGFGLYEIREN
ncbi:MAG: phospholipid carrier-dependent glycosyltransferase [Deltaproteobacteria bacterium]|nr:phospholipid carrier-dependent glycosyltransferase [Deltaproteobacteria bacterium]